MSRNHCIIDMQMIGSRYFVLTHKSKHKIVSSTFAITKFEKLALSTPSLLRLLSTRLYPLSLSSNCPHSDEEKIPPYYRPKHRPSVAVDATSKVVTTSTVSQLRYVRLTVAQARA
jgi:hypothetical protein